MRRIRLALLAAFSLFALMLLGGTMTGFAVAGEPAEASGDLVHIGMLMLLVAGLLGSLEVHLLHAKKQDEPMRVA